MESNINKYFAEFLGTFLLVLVGVGAAVLAGKFIGLVGISFAFGLTLMILAYCLGPISGCHINPAVTLGLWFARKFPASHVIPYIVVQLVGAIAGAAVVYFIASGHTGFNVHEGFASNGFGDHSPMGYTATAAALTEIIMTALLLFVILCTTRPSFPAGCGPYAIGVTLIAIHLVSIPVTNTSVNFARTLATAVFAEGAFISQLWLFAASHVVAALLAVGVFKWLYCMDCKESS